MFLLKCGRQTLYRMAADGRLRQVKSPAGKIEWNDHDVLTLAGFDPAGQLNVIYARVDPRRVTTESAEARLEAQKERLMRYCQAEGIKVDLVLGEARRVNRLLDGENDPYPNFNTMMGLLAEKRIGKLIIDTPDRVMVGSSWAMFEFLVKSICGCEVVVLNKQLVTTESKEESKLWLQDMLTLHKALTGEIKDKELVRSFAAGVDKKITTRLVQAYEKKERNKRRSERDGAARQGKGYKKPIDLTDVFDGVDDGKAYQNKSHLPYVLQTP